MKKGLSIYALDTSGYLAVPYAEDGVQAGFPSPATDYISRPIDINSILVKHPSNTFIIQADEDFFPESGIMSGDILVFDRSIMARQADIIAYTSDGEFKLMRKEVAGDIAGLSVWGVLTAVIKINRESVYWDIVPEDILPEEISKLKLPYLVQEQIIGKVDLNKILK